MKIDPSQKLRLPVLFLLSCCLFTFTGCNNAGKTENASVTDTIKKETSKDITAIIPPKLIDTKLQVLYLENFPGPGHNQLHQLLNGNHGRGEKLVFQFYHKSSEILTLRGWPTKQLNSEFDISEVQELKIDPNVNHIYSTYDIAGKDAYLGDQQISKRDALNILKPVENTILHPHPDAKYIIFEPDLNGNNHVYYNLYTTPDINLIADSSAIAKTPLHVKTDPSPPAPAN